MRASRMKPINEIRKPVHKARSRYARAAAYTAVALLVMTQLFGCAGSTGQAASSPEVRSAIQSAQANEQNAPVVSSIADGYYAYVAIRGDIPENLTEIDRWDNVAGQKFVLVTRDTAKELVRDNINLVVFIEYGDETAETALVELLSGVC